MFFCRIVKNQSQQLESFCFGLFNEIMLTKALVLVTGANGFLAGHIITALLAKGNSLVPIVQISKSSK